MYFTENFFRIQKCSKQYFHISRFFQTSLIDLKRATDAIKDTIYVLKQKKITEWFCFSEIIFGIKREQLNVEIKSLRIVPRHRENN